MRQNPCCGLSELAYLALVDWQQSVALAIVGLTVAIMLWSRLRPRKPSLSREGHCSCCAGADPPSRTSIVFHAKKGERPKVIYRAR